MASLDVGYRPDFGPRASLSILAVRRRPFDRANAELRDKRVSNYFGDYVTVAVFLLIGAVVVGGGVIAAKMLQPNNPTTLKSQVYECGIEPIGSGWSQSHVRYYIFALLFLIFDVEAIFIFPWAVNLETFANAGFGVFILVEMFIFIAILVLGLVYAVRKGVLTWE